MEKVTILQFRRDAESVIRKVRQGNSMLLTYRGKPVMRLEPVRDCIVDPDDPFYALASLAAPDERSGVEKSSHAQSLTNEEIDEIVYKG